MCADTLNKKRLLDELKDPETRRIFYAEHISTALPIQIHELRKKRKMTQAKLAKAAGMLQSRISDLENPNYEYDPQIGTLKQLADAFDVPLIVRFGSWEELWDWEHNLSPERLTPRNFDEALPDLERSITSRGTGFDAPKFIRTVSTTKYWYAQRKLFEDMEVLPVNTRVVLSTGQLNSVRYDLDLFDASNVDDIPTGFIQHNSTIYYSNTIQ